MPEETTTQVPPQDDGGQTTEQPKETKSAPEVPATDAGKTPDPQLPDNLKGKSIEDIARMHKELEKKLGEHSSEIHNYRTELAQWKQLGQVISQDPELYKAIEKKVAGEKENPTTPQAPVRDDTRVALENTIIDKFVDRYGLNNLPPEKRSEINKKIGNSLGEMLDPAGTKTYQQILSSISLDRLPKFLENAYKLATSDDREERARMEAYLTAKQNNEAAFGSIPSSNGISDSIQLTPAQKEVARKMGISEADYLIEVKKIQGDK